MTLDPKHSGSSKKVNQLRIDGQSVAAAALQHSKDVEEAKLSKLNEVKTRWEFLSSLVLKHDELDSLSRYMRQWSQFVCARKKRRRQQIAADLFRRYKLFQWCFMVWCCATQEFKVMRSALNELKANWFRSSAHPRFVCLGALRQWKIYTAELKQEAIHLIVAGRFRWRTLTGTAFEQWKRYVLAKHIHLQELDRASQHYEYQFKFKLLKQWRNVTFVEKNDRLKLEKLSQRIAQRRCFRFWVDVVCAERQLEVAQEHWRKRVLRQSVCVVWRFWSSRRRLDKWAMELAERHWRHHSIMQCMGTWKAWYIRRVSRMQLNQQNVDHLRKLRMKLKLKSWYEWTQRRGMCRFRNLRGIVHWERKQLQSTLHHWQFWLSWSRMNRTLNQIATTHYRTTLLRRSWNQLVIFSLACIEQKVQLGTALVHWSRKLLRKSLHSWNASAQKNILERYNYQTALNGRVRCIGRWWKRWAGKRRRSRLLDGAGGGGYQFRRNRPEPRIGSWLKTSNTYVGFQTDKNRGTGCSHNISLDLQNQAAVGMQYSFPLQVDQSSFPFSTSLNHGTMCHSVNQVDWFRGGEGGKLHDGPRDESGRAQYNGQSIRMVTNAKQNIPLNQAHTRKLSREPTPHLGADSSGTFNESETNAVKSKRRREVNSIFPYQPARIHSYGAISSLDNLHPESSKVSYQTELNGDAGKVNVRNTTVDDRPDQGNLSCPTTTFKIDVNEWVRRIRENFENPAKLELILQDIVKLKRENKERLVTKRKLTSLIDVLADDKDCHGVPGIGAIVSKLAKLQSEIDTFQEFMDVVKPLLRLLTSD